MKKKATKTQREASRVVEALKKKYKSPGRVTSQTLSRAMGICPRTFYKRRRNHAWTEGDIIAINYLHNKNDVEVIEILDRQKK